MAWVIAAGSLVGGALASNANKQASNDLSVANARARYALQQGAGKGIMDVNKLFPAAREQADLGFQGALDVYGQSVPSQINAFQQGNVGAQQQILAGLPQMQNAILGGNVDYSALQPMQVNADLGYLNQQLPQSSPMQVGYENILNGNSMGISNDNVGNSGIFFKDPSQTGGDFIGPVQMPPMEIGNVNPLAGNQVGGKSNPNGGSGFYFR